MIDKIYQRVVNDVKETSNQNEITWQLLILEKIRWINTFKYKYIKIIINLKPNNFYSNPFFIFMRLFSNYIYHYLF